MMVEGDGPAQRTPQEQRRNQQEPESFETTLLFDTGDGATPSNPTRLPIVITPALAKVFVRAALASKNNANDPPLSFSSLLVAMLSNEDTWLQRHFEYQQVRFDEIRKHRNYDVQSLRSLKADGLLPEYLTTRSARSALEESARIAQLASGSTVIDVRHLGAAYPILPGWHLADFQRFEIDRLEWARAFGAEMARKFPQERPYWGSYADRASPVPLTSFSADVYTEEDLLGIDRSVDALALLIASTRTITPLAIGVFGPWGSGKTFFMRHLQKRIVGIRTSEEARIAEWITKRNRNEATPEDAPLYFGEIAQVEFNAWHYNEGNLVASLVEHLFRNLRVLPNEGEQELDMRRAEVFRRLKVLSSKAETVEEAIKEAEQKLESAKANVESKTRDAEEAREHVRKKAGEVESQNTALAEERNRFNKAIKAIELNASEVDPLSVAAVAFAPLETLVREVRVTLRLIRDEAFDWKNFILSVFSPKGLVIVALVVLGPLVAWLANVLEGHWAALISSASALLSGLGSAIRVIQHHRATFEAKMAELQATQHELAETGKAKLVAQHEQAVKQAHEQLSRHMITLDGLRAAVAMREEAVTRAAHELTERAREHEAKLAERIEAERQVREAEAERKRLTSALLLEEFIKDRSSTDEYRKQLGFLALVRRDIERLSMLIDQANKNWLNHKNSDPPPQLNRIVLYIDDLDRCKESTVLAVLEAVHLLLAFPLFVCAVAVDPRWIEQCLRRANPDLFDNDDHGESEAGESEKPVSKSNGDIARKTALSRNLGTAATVGDYLEKIFQIPIWMVPIGKRARAALVNSLLGPTATPAPKSGRDGARGEAGFSAQIEQHSGIDQFQQLVVKARERPDPLRISPDEARFIDEIAGLLSDRPRALKRFVNVYRLLKASLPDIERGTFVDDSPSSSFRVCLSQLALFTSQPRLAPVLVAAIGKPQDEADTSGNGSAQQHDVTLVQWIEKLASPRHRDIEAAVNFIPHSDVLLLEPFRYWLPYTSRYLFHRAD